MTAKTKSCSRLEQTAYSSHMVPACDGTANRR
ncbi:hypothetical protein J2Z17_002931 [Rhizobium halophytocola]|uniref:Uncharacterized protein n=1 Tax=Rhizobium halophytocola TaxID=735519 RepID=A0ABS4E0M7_9HYPH|nr:hypothetical protein [Rhizobium halophytocola]